jgi:energy-coupling factor transport system substrate-specific component
MGDRILIRFSELIREALGEGNCAGRMGGDEFIGYLKNELDEDRVAEITRYLNRELVKSAKEYMGQDMEIPLGTSIGVVRAPLEGTDFHELFKLADAALYQVKKAGGRGCRIHGEET